MYWVVLKTYYENGNKQFKYFGAHSLKYVGYWEPVRNDQFDKEGLVQTITYNIDLIFNTFRPEECLIKRPQSKLSLRHWTHITGIAG